MEYTVERFDARQWSDDQMNELFSEGFPPFITSDPIAHDYIKRVWGLFGEYHIILVNSDNQPVGSGWGVPVRWNGKITDLPSGYTDSLVRSVKGYENKISPNTFVICAGIVNPKFSRKGLAGQLILEFKELATKFSLPNVIVPIRPTLKHKYPLTNIALALTKAPEIKEKMEEIVLMGGGTFGNWTPTAEFNIWVDPEVAKKVMDSNIKKVVMGLDITHQALATEEVIQKIKGLDNKVARTLSELLEFFTGAYKKNFNFDSPPVHDVLTVAYCIEPCLFTCKDVNISVETKGEYTNGTTSVDLYNVTGRNINAKFGVNLDAEGFWELMINSLRKYSS